MTRVRVRCFVLTLGLGLMVGFALLLLLVLVLGNIVLGIRFNTDVKDSTHYRKVWVKCRV